MADEISREEFESLLSGLNSSASASNAENNENNNLSQTTSSNDSTELENEQLKQKGGRSASSLYEGKMKLANGQELSTIYQNVEIVNKETKTKFEEQKVAIFENPKGDSTLLVVSQGEKVLASVEENKSKQICVKLSADYVNKIIATENRSEKEQAKIKNIFGDKLVEDENGNSYYLLSPAEGSKGKVSLSKNLNLDTIEFQSSDGKTYGIKFSAIGMQLKYADGSDAVVLTNQLNLKEKDGTEGENPYDVAISSAYFEKADNKNIVVSNELKGEVLDNILVCALRSRTRARKVEEMQISDNLKLVSVPFGGKDSVVDHLDIKIEDNKPYIYAQIKKTGGHFSSKPRFYPIERASVMQNTKGEKFLYFDVSTGDTISSIRFAIENKTALKNTIALTNKLLQESFKVGTRFAEKNNTKKIESEKLGESETPVFEIGSNSFNEISGTQVASLSRETLQQQQSQTDDDDGNDGKTTTTSSTPPKEDIKKDDDVPKQAPPEEPIEELPAEEPNETKPNTENNPQKNVNKKKEKPKISIMDGMDKFFGSNTILGVAILLVMISTLVPFIAPIAALLLGGFCFQQAEGFKTLKTIGSFFDKNKVKDLEEEKKHQLEKIDENQIKNTKDKIDKLEKNYIKGASLLKKIREEKDKEKKAKYQKQLDELIAHNNFIKDEKELEERKKQIIKDEELDAQKKKGDILKVFDDEIKKLKDKKAKKEQKKDKKAKKDKKIKNASKTLEDFSMSESPAVESPVVDEITSETSTPVHSAGDEGRSI